MQNYWIVKKYDQLKYAPTKMRKTKNQKRKLKNLLFLWFDCLSGTNGGAEIWNWKFVLKIILSFKTLIQLSIDGLHKYNEMGGQFSLRCTLDAMPI